ncbi:RNA-binding domain-containing protein [Neocallimastix californiae]|jgi:U11/U12 small nuclear ribonucleoprotein SNRNP35|uniref:RNA-binding domain-containing protein n=1 Tax=Neocallimastix californiae TaxID=1754190 RepID=A0A1Y2BPU2_9FUNG|nr:RNA-binding domain-containing protein [Neocallimastix californiae]|eukprot:ORY36764.1 RNA-binding domain-containing protein [Neocallimastix californiae]
MWYLEKYDPLLAGSIDGTDTLAHDHGIVRALNSYYSIKKPVISSLTSNALSTLFIGRLNEKTNENDLKNIFSKYGKIKSVRVVFDIVTGISRGYGFVEFETEKDCKKAYKNGDNIQIDGKKILIDYERARVMKDWIPRRLGGGFGGKKESGQLRFGSIDRPFKEPLNIAENQKMPDIAKNQKYNDCWRDYLNKNQKYLKSDNCGCSKERRHSKEKSHRQNRDHNGERSHIRDRNHGREKSIRRDSHSRERSSRRDNHSRERSSRRDNHSRERSRKRGNHSRERSSRRDNHSRERSSRRDSYSRQSSKKKR